MAIEFFLVKRKRDLDLQYMYQWFQKNESFQLSPRLNTAIGPCPVSPPQFFTINVHHDQIGRQLIIKVWSGSLLLTISTWSGFEHYSVFMTLVRCWVDVIAMSPKDGRAAINVRY